jgi:hypothetical protein
MVDTAPNRPTKHPGYENDSIYQPGYYNAGIFKNGDARPTQGVGEVDYPF